MSNYLGSLWTDPKVDGNPTTELANDIINSAITEPYLTLSKCYNLRKAWYNVLESNKSAAISSLTQAFYQDTANPSYTNINDCKLGAYIATTMRKAWVDAGWSPVPADQLIPFGNSIAKTVYKVRAPKALAEFQTTPITNETGLPTAPKVVTVSQDGTIPTIYLMIKGNNVNLNSKSAQGNAIGQFNDGDVVIQVGNIQNGYVPVDDGAGKQGWVSNKYVEVIDTSEGASIATTPAKPAPTNVTPGGAGATSTPQQTYVTLTPQQKPPTQPVPDSYYPAKDNSDTDTDKSEGLSTAAKVGIGVGIAAAVVGAIVVAVKLRKK